MNIKDITPTYFGTRVPFLWSKICWV